MDPEVKELYQKSGISHLLAISGLHLALIGNAFYGLLRKGGCSFLSAGVISVTVLGTYACMTGMSVSTQRALLMFALRLGAEAAGRVYDLSYRTFCGSGMGRGRKSGISDRCRILLSFGAILGIILLLCPALQELFAGKRKLLQALCGSVAVTVFLYPLTSFFYYEISPYAVFLNLIVIPLMSWILGAGIVGLCIAFLWMPAGGILLKSCGVLLEVYEMLCRMLLRLPCAVVVTGKPELWQIFIYYGFLLGFVLYMRKQMKKRKIAGKETGKTEEKKWEQKNERQKKISKGVGWSRRQKTGSCFLIWTYAVFKYGFSEKNMEVTFLDVGQGDGIFIRTESGLTCMIDGGSTDVKEVGKYRIEPFLKSKGVRKLDYVFITHGDQDHLSGIAELLDRQAYGIRIDTLVLPEKSMWDDALWELARQADRRQTAVAAMQKGDVVGDSEVLMECIQPAKDSEAEPGNAGSLVLKLTCQNQKLLFTGDVEGKGEEELVEDFSEEILLLKVAHHGSKNSTFEPFLEQTRPKYAVISAGIDNSYGHPGKETLLRLKKYGAKIYSTQDHGAISFFMEDGKAYLTGWK